MDLFFSPWSAGLCYSDNLKDGKRGSLSIVFFACFSHLFGGVVPIINSSMLWREVDEQAKTDYYPVT
jgi:hypothetical protein